MDDVYRDRQDPAVTVGLRLLAPRDAESRDLDGAYALVWTTTPWTLPSNLAVAVHPDVEYVLVETADTTAHPASGSSSPRPGWARYARELGDDPRVLRRLTGAELLGTALRPAVRLLRGPGERAPGAGRRLRHDRRRHRARAHRAGVRRGGQGRHGRGGDRGRRPGRHPRRVRRAPCRRTRACRCSTRTRRSSATCQRRAARAGPAAAPRDLRPPVPALLALRQPADPAGRRLVVRAGHAVPRPDGRAEPADHLGARAHPATASSASGWRARATGRSPATGTGARRSRCGSATTRGTRARTSTARWTSWSATSACGRRTCTGPSSTS